MAWYNKYSKEITQIMDFIKNEKPFLFKNANIDNVEFSFYEVKGDNENVMYKNFILEENYSIDEQIMKKHTFYHLIKEAMEQEMSVGREIQIMKMDLERLTYGKMF